MRAREADLNHQIEELQEQLANPPPVTEQQLLERARRGDRPGASLGPGCRRGDAQAGRGAGAARWCARPRRRPSGLREEAEQQAATRTEDRGTPSGRARAGSRSAGDPASARKRSARPTRAPRDHGAARPMPVRTEAGRATRTARSRTAKSSHALRRGSADRARARAGGSRSAPLVAPGPGRRAAERTRSAARCVPRREATLSGRDGRARASRGARRTPSSQHRHRTISVPPVEGELEMLESASDAAHRRSRGTRSISRVKPSWCIDEARTPRPPPRSGAAGARRDSGRRGLGSRRRRARSHGCGRATPPTRPGGTIPLPPAAGTARPLRGPPAARGTPPPGSRSRAEAGRPAPPEAPDEREGDKPEKAEAEQAEGRPESPTRPKAANRRRSDAATTSALRAERGPRSSTPLARGARPRRRRSVRSRTSRTRSSTRSARSRARWSPPRCCRRRGHAGSRCGPRCSTSRWPRPTRTAYRTTRRSGCGACARAPGASCSTTWPRDGRVLAAAARLGDRRCRRRPRRHHAAARRALPRVPGPGARRRPRRHARRGVGTRRLRRSPRRDHAALGPRRGRPLPGLRRQRARADGPGANRSRPDSCSRRLIRVVGASSRSPNRSPQPAERGKSAPAPS